MRFLIALITFAVAFNASALITKFGSNSETNTGTKIYDAVYIKVKATSTIQAGTIVKLDVANSPGDGITVTSSSNVYDKALCMADEAISTGAYGKCLVFGYTTKLLFVGEAPSTGDLAASPSVAGGPLYPAYTDGYARAIASATTFDGTFKMIGISLGANTASGAIKAFVNLL